MLQRYCALALALLTTTLMGMNMSPRSSSHLKSLLNKQTKENNIDQHAPVYQALKHACHGIEFFLDQNPEYAQQIIDLIAQRMCHIDLEPAYKSIIRIIYHKKFFLGERTQNELNNMIDHINHQNKNI